MNLLVVIFGTITMLLLYGGANYYIARRIYQLLSLFLPKIYTNVFIGIYIFISVLMVLKFIFISAPINGYLKYVINWISSYWMGIFLYLLLFFILADLFMLLIKIIPVPLPQQLRISTSLIVVVLSLALFGFGVYNANQLRQVSYEIQTSKNPLSDEINLVLISDLHLGAINSEKRLDKIVKEINDLKPDIVCIAGDIFDNDYYAIQDPLKAIQLLRSIIAKYGVYACLGNHDEGKTFSDMQQLLEQSNIKCLNEEYVTIDNRLILVGRVDATTNADFGELERKETSELLSEIDKKLPVVVMDHNPANIGQYGDEVDVILCGHTHQGQMWPGNWITDSIYEVAYGYYQKDAGSPHVIVTSGAGTWGMPMRIGSKCEIVSIKLQF